MSTISEMTSLLAALYAAFESGDSSAWEEALAEDAVCIGTDEAEWSAGARPAGMLPIIEGSAAVGDERRRDQNDRWGRGGRRQG